jgi:AcrR family transcriptional regulator
MASQPTTKSVAKRRAPAQARARQTREMILEAAIQLLEKRGLLAFSTNRLATAAGFSVGTIYQYFENKQEILDALGRHERDRRLARITEALTSRTHESGAQKRTLRDRIRIVVRTELHAFDGRQRARKILFDLAWRSDSRRDMDRPPTTLSAMLAAGEVTDGEGIVQLSPTDAFILTQGVAGIIRAGLERDEHMLVTPEFEDAMVELIAGFVDARRRLTAHGKR